MMLADQMPAAVGDDDESVRRLFGLLTETNNEMAVLHRELAQKTRALEAAIAQNNEFLGMAAHDLRNPLHIIGGMSAVLLRSPNVDDTERRLLQSICDSSAFMRRLVDDLLQVSEFEGGMLRLALEPLELSDLVTERVELQRLIAADKQIAIQTRFQRGVPTIRAGTTFHLCLPVEPPTSGAMPIRGGA